MKRQRKTLFKVACRETRKGSNFVIANHALRKKYTTLFVHTYTKDSTIIAMKHTLGIFVFRTRKAAEGFIDLYDINREAIILQVKPIGRGKVPKVIAYGGIDVGVITDFYLNSLEPSQLTSPPKGAICYPAVMVLN